MMSSRKLEEHNAETLGVIRTMEEALGANSDDMAAHFHENFRWFGNQGCGTKHGLGEFRCNWQLPFRAAFSERVYKTERFVVEGDWASCFGHIEATHSGVFMGIEATGKRVRVPYMDFWHVKDGRVADNWVSVDFPAILAQLGVDVFGGQGWEKLDSGEMDVPRARA